MKINRKYIHATLCFVLGLIVLGGTFFLYHKQQAQAFGGQFFGGRVVSMIPCTCSSGYQVSITGPGSSSGTYLYNTPRTYRERSVHPGGILLGSYSSGGTCLITATPSCITLPITKGTMTSIGTSF